MSRQKITWCAIAFVCGFHLIAVMSYLLREGRLSIVPIYDDVVYLTDGLQRLAALDRSGIAGFMSDFVMRPAHAPFVAVAAAFGFLLSAGAVWGPYLLNGAWVFIISSLALVVLRGLGNWSRLGIVLAIIAIPMFGSAVAEFRPDPVWGLLLGMSLAIMATIDIAQSRRSRLIALGLLFGVSAIAKPTAAPASLVVLAVGFVTQLGMTFLLQPGWPVRSAIRRTAIVALGAGLVVVPYFLVNGAEILAYIRNVMDSGNKVWRTQASFQGHLAYYLNKGTGTLMLGWLWYLAIPILLCCAAILVRIRDRRALASLGALVSALLAAYVIVSVSEVKSLMIGSLLYGAIIGAVVWSLGAIVRYFPIRHFVVFVLGAGIFLVQWTPHAGMIRRADPAMASTDDATKAVFPAVLAALQVDERKAALVTVPGPVYAGSLDFLARQQGVVRRFSAAYTWDRWELFAEGVAAADIIVLSEPGMRGQALGFSFPSVHFQQKLLSTLRADATFSGRPMYTDEQGRSVWVFVRR
jgi:hypothetical protein